MSQLAMTASSFFLVRRSGDAWWAVGFLACLSKEKSNSYAMPKTKGYPWRAIRRGSGNWLTDRQAGARWIEPDRVGLVAEYASCDKRWELRHVLGASEANEYGVSILVRFCVSLRDGSPDNLARGDKRTDRGLPDWRCRLAMDQNNRKAGWRAGRKIKGSPGGLGRSRSGISCLVGPVTYPSSFFVLRSDTLLKVPRTGQRNSATQYLWQN